MKTLATILIFSISFWIINFITSLIFNLIAAKRYKPSEIPNYDTLQPIVEFGSRFRKKEIAIRLVAFILAALICLIVETLFL